MKGAYSYKHRVEKNVSHITNLIRREKERWIVRIARNLLGGTVRLLDSDIHCAQVASQSRDLAAYEVEVECVGVLRRRD